MSCRSSILCVLSLLPLVPAQAQSRYGRLPMHFEMNHGQTDARVRFLARGAGYAFFITDTETVAVLQKESAAPAVLRMRLIGASEHPRVEARELLEGKSNYVIGSDPSRWRTNVPRFGKVRLSGVYDGIDVVYYGNQGQIEYDFVVAPRSDPGLDRARAGGRRCCDPGPRRQDADAAGRTVGVLRHVADGAEVIEARSAVVPPPLRNRASAARSMLNHVRQDSRAYLCMYAWPVRVDRPPATARACVKSLSSTAILKRPASPELAI